MANFVEFYFHGISITGQNQREVKSRNPKDLGSIPAHAYAFRFYESNSVNGPKSNVSPYHYIGEELSVEKMKKSVMPPIPLDLEKCKRLVQLSSGGFRAMNHEDIVISPF